MIQQIGGPDPRAFRTYVHHVSLITPQILAHWSQSDGESDSAVGIIMCTPGVVVFFFWPSNMSE